MDASPEYADCGWDLEEKCIIPHRVAVHPDYMGKGVAKLMFAKAEDLAKN
jgi:GNAT superfamily N-acetyltransferase